MIGSAYRLWICNRLGATNEPGSPNYFIAPDAHASAYVPRRIIPTLTPSIANSPLRASTSIGS